jgi:hypothetical protein
MCWCKAKSDNIVIRTRVIEYCTYSGTRVFLWSKEMKVELSKEEVELLMQLVDDQLLFSGLINNSAIESYNLIAQKLNEAIKGSG